jgi:hypothetical protein
MWTQVVADLLVGIEAVVRPLGGRLTASDARVTGGGTPEAVNAAMRPLVADVVALPARMGWPWQRGAGDADAQWVSGSHPTLMMFLAPPAAGRDAVTVVNAANRCLAGRQVGAAGFAPAGVVLLAPAVAKVLAIATGDGAADRSFGCVRSARVLEPLIVHSAEPTRVMRPVAIGY